MPDQQAGDHHSSDGAQRVPSDHAQVRGATQNDQQHTAKQQEYAAYPVSKSSQPQRSLRGPACRAHAESQRRRHRDEQHELHGQRNESGLDTEDVLNQPEHQRDHPLPNINYIGGRADLIVAEHRALGQRTTSANARGIYITESLQLKGQLKVDGKTMTLDAIRTLVATPSLEQLSAASLDENLQFLRYLVNPRKAEGQHLLFTISLAGEPPIRSVVLRNSVLVSAPAEARATRHVTLSRREHAEFVLGRNVPDRGGNPLDRLNRSLDRSQLMPLSEASPQPFTDKGKQKLSDDLEH
jgi:hypothetical protein